LLLPHYFYCIWLYVPLLLIIKRAILECILIHCRTATVKINYIKP